MCHVEDPNKGKIELNRTAKYKHLGTYHVSGDSLDVEIHHRVGVACATWSELSLSLFGPHKLTKPTKIKLAFSLILTKLLHGADAWPVLSLRQLGKLNSCYLGILRSTTHNRIIEVGAIQEAQKIDLTASYECHCGSMFLTMAQLGAHKRKAHGEHSDTFWIAQGTQCYVCMRKHSRLQQHLDYAPRSGRPNRCRTFCMLFPDSAALDLKAKDVKAPPVPGLGRNEAIRVQGPLALGARREHSSWAWEWRKQCEEYLTETLNLPEPEVLRDSELQTAFERAYAEGCGTDLGNLLEYLSECNHGSDRLGVNLLFWGWNKRWNAPEEKQSWVEIIQSCSEGPACLGLKPACVQPDVMPSKTVLPIKNQACPCQPS